MSTEATAAIAEAAVCAAHPDARSTGACPRCGTFVCERCGPAALHRVCPACRPVVFDPLGVVAAKFGIAEAFLGAVKLIGACWGRVMLLSLPFALGGGLISAAVTPGDLSQMRDPVLNLLRMLPFLLYAGTLGVLGHLAVVATYVGAAEGRRVTIKGALLEGFAAWGKGVSTGILRWLKIFLFSLACGLPGVWKAVLLAVTTVCVFRLPDTEGTEESERLVRPRVWECVLVSVVWYALTVVPGSVAFVMRRASGGVLPSLTGHLLQSFVGGVWAELVSSLFVAFFYGLARADGRTLPQLPWRSKPALSVSLSAPR